MSTVVVVVNGIERTVGAGTSVADLVGELAVGAAGVAVAVDSQVVPRSGWATSLVSDGARVEVVTAMQGG